MKSQNTEQNATEPLPATSSEKSNDLSALATPLGFTRGVLGLETYDWTARILMDLDQPGNVAVRACNGAGKTTRLAAPAALWNAVVFPGSLTVATAGVFRQVSDQLFAAIRAHSHRFRGWVFNEAEVTTPQGSRIIGQTSEDPGRFEGWHSDNLLMIVDEAKSVPDKIFEAVERCQPTRLLLISSPGGPQGYFYHAFNGRRKFFRQHKVTAADCPHIKPAWIQEMREKYGDAHPLVKSMIDAEFMTTGEDGEIISLSHIELLLANPPELGDMEKHGLPEVQAFCDFAAGRDENVLAIRTGNKIELADCWRERNTMKAVGRFIENFKKRGLTPGQIAGDEGGLGKVMCDRLEEEGWGITRVNNGSPSSDPEHYANVIAEMWYVAAVMIERQQIILPNDAQLVGQLSSRKGWPNSKGRLELESKEDVRSRGLPSPDRADAVLGTLLKHGLTIFLA